MSFILQLVGLALLATAAYIGLKLPDIDQQIGFLLHRSIITHGPLLPLLAFAFAQSNNPILRRFGTGIGVGFAVHMAFDLFPRGWQGYALISFPGYGWTPAVFSWIWIAATMLICFGIAVRLGRSAIDGVLLLIAVIATFLFAASNENALWRPLGVTVASLLVCYWMIGPDKDKNSLEKRSSFR